jgi:epoxyqueuosine reductase QueG
MKTWLENEIIGYVRAYERQPHIQTRWKTPLFAYADALDPLFTTFSILIGPTHCLPQDFLADAKAVVTYFLPFDETIGKSNIPGRLSSLEWGRAYIETNQLIFEINTYAAKLLAEKGFESGLPPLALNFEASRLMSDWSQRHAAYVAGLGTLGINNMLITTEGCVGRIGSFVTNLTFEPTPRPDGDYCLYKANGTCGQCVEQCVHNALFFDHFDQHRCYEMCVENAEHLKNIGLADVCGKCLVGMPCSFKGYIPKAEQI